MEKFGDRMHVLTFLLMHHNRMRPKHLENVLFYLQNERIRVHSAGIFSLIFDKLPVNFDSSAGKWTVSISIRSYLPIDIIFDKIKVEFYGKNGHLNLLMKEYEQVILGSRTTRFTFFIDPSAPAGEYYFYNSTIHVGKMRFDFPKTEEASFMTGKSIELPPLAGAIHIALSRPKRTQFGEIVSWGDKTTAFHKTLLVHINGNLSFLGEEPSLRLSCSSKEINLIDGEDGVIYKAGKLILPLVSKNGDLCIKCSHDDPLHMLAVELSYRNYMLKQDILLRELTPICSKILSYSRTTKR
jgi:hypothetical protein